jgi:hypothetical protein
VASNRRASTSAVQGVAAVVGITFGIIPLIGLVVGRGLGLLTPLIGESGPWAQWWFPAGVVIACGAVIVVLERSAHR